MAETDASLELERLAVVLASDHPCPDLDAIYVHALTDGMLEASRVLEFVAQLFRERQPNAVAFNGSDGHVALNPLPKSGWCGADEYASRLTRLGVPAGALVATGPGMHTMDETDKLVFTARERNWRRIGIVTMPYHLPRSFCCLVKSIQQHGGELSAWALCPPSTDWYHPMVGSQAGPITTPFAEALEDAKRTLSYIDKGYGAPVPDVIAYLASR